MLIIILSTSFISYLGVSLPDILINLFSHFQSLKLKCSSKMMIMLKLLLLMAMTKMIMKTKDSSQITACSCSIYQDLHSEFAAALEF